MLLEMNVIIPAIRRRYGVKDLPFSFVALVASATCKFENDDTTKFIVTLLIASYSRVLFLTSAFCLSCHALAGNLLLCKLISFWFAFSGFFFGFGLFKVVSDGWFVLSFNVFERFVC